ncbi:MAG TPA: arsenate reductase (glutaredoxin) [Gammaproteobacteria bacterium]
MNVTIYHNPRCSKSRRTLALLREHGAAPKIVDYLVDPPDAKALDRILRLLHFEPRELMRAGEPAYRALGLSDATLSREALIDAMCANPVLIQRPIVLANSKAAVGRPPEKVLAIL